MKRFILLFLLILSVLFGVEILAPVQAAFVVPFTSVLADISSALVSPFDPNVIASGKIIQNKLTGVAVSVEPGCNGIEACIVLTAAIWAFPASLRSKLIGWIVGLFAVQGLNIIRIISLFYLLQWDYSWFKFAHEYLWQGLIMLDVLVVFLIWTSRLKGKSTLVDQNSSAQTPGQQHVS